MEKREIADSGARAAGTTYVLVAADAGQKLQVMVTATNSAGSASATSAQTTTILPAPGGDPTIAAAGDIACDPLSSNFNGGAGKNGACAQRAVSDLIYGQGFSAVLALGDNRSARRSVRLPAVVPV